MAERSRGPERRPPRAPAPGTPDPRERQHGAYIQLRAWAFTGQVATATLLVVLTVGALRSTETSVSAALWPLLLLVVTYQAAVRWLTRRA